jgi:Domain of Unknown Function with PDB structure (DUF3857)
VDRSERVFGSIAFFLLATLLCAPGAAFADDWLPISSEDLALKDNPKQPGADAMILYRQVVVDASKASVSGDSEEEYVRIKVFTQEGTKQGHVEVEFQKQYATVTLVTGRTIHPDGTIEKFDGQVFETTVEKITGSKILAKTFTLPDVQPGCIIEYKYAIQGQPEHVLDWGWNVSRPIYTREARFTYVPYAGYGTDLRPIIRRNMLPADAAPQPQANGSYLMIMHDIPGIVEEPLMPPARPMEAWVKFEYQDQNAPSATDSPEKYWNHYGKKWDDELEKFIDKKKALDQELAKVVLPGDAPEVKLRKIYVRVQQIRNLDVEDYKMAKENKDENLKPNANVEDVLDRGYAHSTQINYLFVGLARAAGFEGTEVYIAPRNTELFVPAGNNVGQLTDEIVWVHAGSQDYYVDPAAHYYPFGLLPWYETGTSGIRVDKRGATIVNTPNPLSTEATIVRTADLEIKQDGEILGTVQVEFTGQRAALLRSEKTKEDDTGRTKYFEEVIESWLPVGSVFRISKISNWENNDQPIEVEGALTISSFTTSASQRMLMPIEVFQMTQMREFSAEKRVNVVYFHYPYEEIDDVKVRFPAGYKVEGLPPARNVNLGAVSCEITATEQGSGVEIKRHLTQRNLIFTRDEYPVLRRFFGTVKANDNAPMVLQNSTSAKN